MPSITHAPLNPRSNVMVFVDADHIRRYTKQKYGHDRLAYDTIGRMLALSATGSSVNLIRIYYYDAVPDMKDVEKIEEKDRKEVQEKIKKIQEEQDEYFALIHKQEYVTIRKGHLQVTTKDLPRQKGVDILMSIDMLTGAFERQYDWAVLVAGDADFLPLVEAVKHSGCNIMGVYWRDHVARELVNAFDKRFELDPQNFENNHFLL